ASLTACILLVPVVPSLWAVIALVTLTGFLSMSFFSPMFAYVELVVTKPEQVGAASGIVNLFGFCGGLLTPYLFGLILDFNEGRLGYLGGYLLLGAFAVAGVIGVFFFRRGTSTPRRKSSQSYGLSLPRLYRVAWSARSSNSAQR
ncbi:MAG: MFS transporter, partial [Thermoleophilia bacterium]|nr:MFS transporter [Thermoleophilia bacterium]